MSARVILTPRPNSHPFQERTVTLEQPLKIGRSVARSRPSSNNAIFDCKVLSRNHALLWYESGKFFLQDSKSSNGTFVNNVRLSKSSEESPPTPISSGDVLQFGVDVMEVTKKVTHGCIVASVQLFTPDGKEAKVVHQTDPTTTTLQDMYALFQYLREAAEREEKLEMRMTELQKVLRNTAEGVTSGWKILIEEDRLLARIDTLERQLLACHKTMTKEKLRDEVIRLNSDREKYQEAAKETLRKSLSEKMEAIKKCQELERSLSAKEEDHRLLTERTSLITQQLEQLASKFVESERKRETMAEQIEEATLKHISEVEEFSQIIKAQEIHFSRDRSLHLSNSVIAASPQQLKLTLNHNADVNLQNDIASMDTIKNLDFQDTTIVSTTSNEPHEPKVLRLSTPPSESDLKVELTKLRERLGVVEDEKKGIVSRLTYLISLFEDLKSVSNKMGVSDFIKEMIAKVDVELRQVKNFTLGDEEPPQHNNYTIEQVVPQSNFLISQELTPNESDEVELLQDDLTKDDNGNGLKKLLEESREMVLILKRENLSFATELLAVKEERGNLRDLILKLEGQGREMSNESGKLLTEVSRLKELVAAAQVEVGAVEAKLQKSEANVKGHMEALDAAETTNKYLRQVINEQTDCAHEWEKLIQECKSLHSVGSPFVSALEKTFDTTELSLKIQEMEEELATFKDRYATSATECSRLSQKLREREAQGGPFYMQSGFLIFIFFSLILAILIALSPR